MSSLDYLTIGRLRLEKDRAEARAERYDQLARRLEPLLRDMGTPAAVRYADELLTASDWDGCPEGPKGHPGAQRTGPKP